MSTKEDKPKIVKEKKAKVAKPAKVEKERLTLPISEPHATEAIEFPVFKASRTIYVNTIADFVAANKASAKVVIPDTMKGGKIYSGLKRAVKKLEDKHVLGADTTTVKVTAFKRKTKDSILLTRCDCKPAQA
jgi:hypothetical protein